MTGRARSSYSAARLAAVLLSSAVALVMAFLAGRSGGSASPQSDHGRSRVSAPSPTRAGAVAAYLEQQAQLADPGLWVAPQGRRTAALRTILATAGLRRSVGRSMRTAVGRRDRLGEALRSGRTVLARSAALGYRVITNSRRRAIVDVWVFSLLGGEGIPLDLRLARYRATERWGGGAWRLAGTRTVGEGSAVRFRGAPQLSARLAINLARFRRVHSEP